MRQLVSVVSDGSLRYFLHDGGEAVQVAQLVDPGVDVPMVVEIGVSLGALYAKLPVNGKEVAPVKAAVSLPAAPAPKEGRKYQPRMRKTTQHSLTIDEIIAYVAEHPGVSHSALASALAPHLENHKRRQLVDNRLRVYFDRCSRTGDSPAVVKSFDSDGNVSYAPVTGD
jgi:hypothetical protein